MPAIFGRFSRSCEAALVKAQELASQMDRPILSDLLIVSILSLPKLPAANFLKESGLQLDQVITNLVNIPDEIRSTNKPGTPGSEMQILLENSIALAAKFHFPFVELEVLLLQVLENPKLSGYQLIQKCGVNPSQIANRVREFLFSMAIMREQQDKIPERPGEMSDSSERFLTNLNDLAMQGSLDPVVGREEELEQLIHILLRRRKNNPLLVGEPGVGKTALIDALAMKIIRRDVPKQLINKKILTLDLGLVVAGTMYRGQFEERLKGIISDIKQDGNIILFIDEIHTLTGAGSSEGSFDAANILKPALARGEVSLIGATTYDEYRKHIMKDKALDRRFQTVTINEPTVKETIKMLKGLKRELEHHHNVSIDDNAIKASAELAARYVHDRFLPDKAIDVLDQACTLHAEYIEPDSRLDELEKQLGIIANQKKDVLENLDQDNKWEIAKDLSTEETNLLREIQILKKEKSKVKRQKPIVNAHHIALTISEKTGIPYKDIEQTLEPMNITRIKEALSKNILGQDEAVRRITQALIRAQIGLNPDNKPIGSFMLVGPTGVGKTETARILAKEVFGDEKALIKIDMSEYMERHNVSNLIGAPAGYVGYEEGGALTEQVRRRPFSVVLFDEVEKAHPDVFHLLLQILEDGVLTDNTGKSSSFEHAIVIMTSNIGMEYFNQAAKIGFDTEEVDTKEVTKQEELTEHIREEIKEFFRPELLGRLSGIIYYKPLSKPVIAKLSNKRLLELKKKLKSRGVELKFSAKACEKIVDLYDPEAGARSLERVFLEQVEPVVIEALISNPETAHISLDVKDDTFITN